MDKLQVRADGELSGAKLRVVIETFDKHLWMATWIFGEGITQYYW